MTWKGVSQIPDLVALPFVRRPYQHRYQAWAPKLSRHLVLTSWPAVQLWAMFEANPLVSRYCERPAFAEIAGVERLIDFWVERVGQQHWFVIDCAGEAALDLEGESASAPSVSTQAVELLSPESFKEHHIWTENWLSILPYLAANARLVDPALVDKVSNECREATALWAIEQRYAREDRMLVRTAVFIALHRGQLVGVDLREQAWGLQSRFVKTPRPYAA